MALNHPRFSANGTGKHPEPPPSPIEARSRSAADALASRYEELNRLWAEAEARLKAMQVPRHTWVTFKIEDIHPEEQYSPSRRECLGLVKVRGEWRLCLGEFVRDDYNPGPDEPDGPEDWKPISECTVEQRVEAAPHVSTLREEIVASAERYLGKVDEAITRLTWALDQF